MAKTITVYSTSTCAYCVMAKKWLAGKRLAYEEVNLEQHPERVREMVELSGQMGVPVIVLKDDDEKHPRTEVVVGFNPPKLVELVASLGIEPQPEVPAAKAA